MMPTYNPEYKVEDIKVEDRTRLEMGDLDELAKSIELKGLIQPITINEDGRLLAGGRRLHAVKSLKWETIPVIIRKTDDNIDEYEIELFENVYRKEMTWQEQTKLIKKIHDLMQSKKGKDWSLTDTGRFLNRNRPYVSRAVSLAEAMEVMPDLAQAKNADQARRSLNRRLEAHAVQEALTDTKHKYQSQYVKWADKHYKEGHDALEGLRKLNSNAYDFFEVDPPYAIDLKNKKPDTSANIEKYNEVLEDDYPLFLEQAMSEVYRALKNDRFTIWWFGPTHFELVRSTLRKVGFHVADVPAIWYKVDSGAASNNPSVYLGNSYEPFFVCRKGNPEMRKRGRSNVFPFQVVPAQNKIHATERPVALIQEILSTFVYPGARLCCPFLGSGNTILAAYHEGMLCFGWELAKDYKGQFLARVVKDFSDKAPPKEEQF